MYNLTVSLVATYLVGDGQWVVHNQEERLIVELFSGPTSQINRTVPGYTPAEALIFTVEIEDYLQIGGNGQFGIRGDATQLPFATGFADEVFLTNMFNEGLRKAEPWERLAFRDAVFASVARVLRPGGILYNSFAGDNKFAKIIEGSNLMQHIQDLGFSLIKPTDHFITGKGNESQVYGKLHPALRGASFGRPDDPASEHGSFQERSMRTLSCQRR